MIRLPKPPARYLYEDQAEVRRALEQAVRDLLARISVLEARVTALETP